MSLRPTPAWRPSTRPLPVAPVGRFRFSRPLAALVLFAAALLASSRAEAALPRSLTAARAALPEDVQLVAVLDARALRRSKIFEPTLRELERSERAVRETLAIVRSHCALDPVRALDDVTLALDPRERTAAFFAFSGSSEQTVLDCVAGMLLQAKGGRGAWTRSGSIRSLRSAKSGDAVHVGWLAGNVLVVTDEPSDRARLERMIGGGGSFATRSELGARLSRIDPSSLLAVSWSKQLPIDAFNIRGGDLAIRLRGGRFEAHARIELADASEASMAAIALRAAPLALVSSGAPPEAKRILASLDAQASGSDLEAKVEADENDLLVLVRGASRSGPRSHPR